MCFINFSHNFLVKEITLKAFGKDYMYYGCYMVYPKAGC